MQIIRQSAFGRIWNARGFTLSEIIVVIALIAVLAVGINSFDYETAADKEKRDRIATKVSSIIRHAKTAAISGKTHPAGNCSGYVVEFWENAITGSIVSFSETGAIQTVCWNDTDGSLPNPFFWERSSYFLPAITGYDKSGNSVFRVANPSDFWGNDPLTSGKSVALIVDGPNLRAYPLSCGILASCVDYSRNAAVKIKVNAAYQQAFWMRDKDMSRDVWIDLRSGNVETKEPTTP